MRGNTLSAARHELNRAYRELRSSSSDFGLLRVATQRLTAKPVEKIAKQMLTNREEVLQCFSNADLHRYFEIRTIILISSSIDVQRIILTKIIEELIGLLQDGRESSHRAAGAFIDCLLTALDDLPFELTDKILSLLGSLTGREEGIQRFQAPPVDGIAGPGQLMLSSLLNRGLASEVYSFIAGGRAPRFPVRPEEPLDVPAAVFSLVSRKGGVGKSTLSLAWVLFLLRSRPGTKVCILDLDLGGPVWQYFLESDTQRQLQPPFLNDLFDIEQDCIGFDFGLPQQDQVIASVAHMRLPATKDRVGLLSLADWPRTNRHLIQAIANSRESFGAFFDAVMRALGSDFDAIVIDNAPGFHPVSLMSLAVTARIKRGFPIVVSTPSRADMRGTILEMSDLRLWRSYRAPLWIVNKASRQAMRFLNTPKTLLKLAADDPSLKEIIPHTPLLKMTLKPIPLSRGTVFLPIDDALRRQGIMESTIGGKQPLSSFIEGKLFKSYVSKVAHDPAMNEVWPHRIG